MTYDAKTVRIEDLLAHCEWLGRLARRLVSDPQAADDVVQETWLVALCRPPARIRHMRSWLATVARNLVRERGRSEATRRRREEQVSRSERLPDTAELVERAELRRYIAGLVLALPEPFRSTVLLRFDEDLSFEEIARRTGIPSSTVRGRLKRGLALLREELDRASKGNRKGWMTALLPLAGLEGARAGMAGSIAAAGGLIVGTKVLVALVVAVVLLLAVVVSWGDYRTEDTMDPGGTRVADAVVPDEPAEDQGEVDAQSGIIVSGPGAMSSDSPGKSPGESSDWRVLYNRQKELMKRLQRTRVGKLHWVGNQPLDARLEELAEQLGVKIRIDPSVRAEVRGAPVGMLMAPGPAWRVLNFCARSKYCHLRFVGNELVMFDGRPGIEDLSASPLAVFQWARRIISTESSIRERLGPIEAVAQKKLSVPAGREFPTILHMTGWIYKSTKVTIRMSEDVKRLPCAAVRREGTVLEHLAAACGSGRGIEAVATRWGLALIPSAQATAARKQVAGIKRTLATLSETSIWIAEGEHALSSVASELTARSGVPTVLGPTVASKTVSVAGRHDNWLAFLESEAVRNPDMGWCILDGTLVFASLKDAGE
jgi:RNA polymerase sigma factor (sigma-70 family)